ncbi:MAG: hypothetical protein J0G34_15675 [Afipia sp.]|nr:hypothetical protein [Afipia sp.]
MAEGISFLLASLLCKFLARIHHRAFPSIQIAARGLREDKNFRIESTNYGGQVRGLSFLIKQ